MEEQRNGSKEVPRNFMTVRTDAEKRSVVHSFKD